MCRTAFQFEQLLLDHQASSHPYCAAHRRQFRTFQDLHKVKPFLCTTRTKFRQANGRNLRNNLAPQLSSARRTQYSLPYRLRTPLRQLWSCHSSSRGRNLSERNQSISNRQSISSIRHSESHHEQHE
jgi:hypothetical protein